MLTTFDKLTPKEIIDLTDKQIEDYARLNLMLRNVPIKSKPTPLPVITIKSNSNKIFVELGGLIVTEEIVKALEKLLVNNPNVTGYEFKDMKSIAPDMGYTVIPLNPIRAINRSSYPVVERVDLDMTKKGISNKEREDLMLQHEEYNRYIKEFEAELNDLYNLRGEVKQVANEFKQLVNIFITEYFGLIHKPDSDAMSSLDIAKTYFMSAYRNHRLLEGVEQINEFYSEIAKKLELDREQVLNYMFMANDNYVHDEPQVGTPLPSDDDLPI